MSLFGAAGVDGALLPVGHLKTAEVFVIAIAVPTLIFIALAHAAFPAVRNFDPRVTPTGPFLVGQLDVHLHGLTRQLVRGISRERLASPSLTLRIDCFAVEKFYDAAFWPHGAE
ncbi:hypothetical protein D3C71_1553600 [compost metagenome]